MLRHSCQNSPTLRRALELLSGSMVIAVLALGCTPADPETAAESRTGPPVASFAQGKTQGFPGLVVQFTDTSSGLVTSSQWDFGARGTSHEQNPRVSFPDVGIYSVRLTTSGPSGTSSVLKDQLIGVYPEIVADFSCKVESMDLGSQTITCTDASQNASSWAWSFGDGSTSTDQNPTHEFTTEGSFVVELVASSPGGSDSHSAPPIEVDFPDVVASFTCDESIGFAPLTVICTDESENATSWAWSFGDGSSSTDQNPTHEFTTDGPHLIELVASGPGGSDSHSTPIDVGVLEIVPNVVTGPAPLLVTFSADTKGLPVQLVAWSIDGNFLGTSTELTHTFNKTGTYRVELQAAGFALALPSFAVTEIEFEVGYAEASADFHPDPADGAGPLSVQMIDDSSGDVRKWEWDFGDGSNCVYPPATAGEPNPPDACNSSSPSHLYGAIGRYDVTLTVTGPGPDQIPPPPDVTSTLSKPDQVRVYIMDPSFEEQVVGQPIAGDWEHLRPTSPTEFAEHRTLALPGDTGFPSHGNKWAVLDGLGTDGSTPLWMIENGIRTEFIYPADRTVLEFDYALLYSEPYSVLDPSPSSDGTVATVNDGTMTVDILIPSSWAGVSTPYAGSSQRFPTRDGSVVRATPLRTASINLADAFSPPTDSTRFTLTIRMGNGEDDRRSPRTYVDNVRFVESVSAALLPVEDFTWTSPVAAGSDVTFVDETCPDPNTSGCLAPSSWRWDFGTHGEVSPPQTTGSAAHSPTYVFDEPGPYQVTLFARLAEAEGRSDQWVDVITRPVASFTKSPEPHIAPTYITFTDTSTVDPTDGIEPPWSWDFGGWGDPSLEILQNPTVHFPQQGEFRVTLTITTVLGLDSSFEMLVVVE